MLARAEGGEVRWEHRQPAAGGRWESSASGAAWVLTELDPLGADVGTESPYEPGVVPAEPAVYDAGSHWGSRAGSPSDPQSGCAVNGLALPCEIYLRLAEENVLAVRHIDPRREGRQVDAPLQSSAGGRGAVWVDTTVDVPNYDPVTMTSGVTSISSGYFINLPVGMAAGPAFAGPQSSGVRNYAPPIDAVAIRSEIERILEDPVCDQFIKYLLAQVSAADPDDLMEGGDVLKVFDRINTPGRGGGGGMVRAGQPGSQSGGSQANGSFDRGRAQIQLGVYPGTAAPAAEEVRRGDARNALAETLHHAGWNVYYDHDYALAISRLPRVGVLSEKGLLPKGTGDPYGADRYLYSGYFHPVVDDICK